MRVLVTTSGLEGHFFPMVPLAWSLRSQGHEVLVSAPSNFSPVIINAGLWAASAVPPIEFGGFMLHDRDGNPVAPPREQRDRKEFGGRAWGRLAAHSLDATMKLVESFKPDLVISEPNEYAGPLAAAHHGIPWAEHGWGIMAMPEFVPASEAELAPELDKLNRQGIPEPDWKIDTCPSSLRDGPPPDALPMRYVPYNGSAVTPEWVLRERDRPRVLVTMGSLFPRHGRLDFVGMLKEFAEALPSLGVEVVIAVAGDLAERWQGLPRGVRAAGWLPLNVTLPACDLVVHHGGAGSTLTTVLAGLPQLATPQIVDQFANSARVVAAGAGLAVPPEELSARAVFDRCATLLSDPTFAENAAKVAAENAARETPAAIAARLASFVDGQ